MWWVWVQRLQISENSRALGRGDRNRGERLTQCGHRVSAEWAGVPLGGPSSGGWKSETKASVESAPSEAVRVALLQASLPAAGAAARHHITQISAFVFTWRPPVRQSPSLL